MKHRIIIGITSYLIGIPIWGFTSSYLSLHLIKFALKTKDNEMDILWKEDNKESDKIFFREALIWPIHVSKFVATKVTSPLYFITDKMADATTTYLTSDIIWKNVNEKTVITTRRFF